MMQRLLLFSGGALRPAVAAVLLAAPGCAWFQNPPIPGSAGEAPASVSLPSEGPDSGPATPADTLLVSDSPKDEQPGTPAERSDADAAGSDDPGAPAPPPSGRARTTGQGPGTPATPPTEADTSSVPLAATAGPDRWELDGDQLSAHSGPGGQIIKVERPVIRHHDLLLKSRQGTYFMEADRARLTGGVTFTDRGITGKSRTADYFRQDERLHAQGEVDLQNDTLRVTAGRATYDRRANIVFLQDNVRGVRGARRLAADAAEWRRGVDEVLLTGRVRVSGEDARSTLEGEEVLYDVRADRAQVTQSPRLTVGGGEGEQATRITGDRLWIEPDGDARASGSVRVRRGGIVARSDSAAFFDRRRQAVLLGDPRVEQRDGTLTGDTLVLHFDENDALSYAEVFGHARMRYAPLDSARAGETSVVAGDSLRMTFDDEGAERVVVFGNATSSYRPSPLDKSSGAGTNSVKGDTISIFLGDEGIENVTVVGNARGVFTFVNDAPDSASAPAAPDSADVLREIETAVPSASKVLYRAKRVEYLIAERRVDLAGDITLDYGSLSLTAGKVRFHADRRYLDAEDDPVLVERQGGEDRTVVGKRMDYNLDTREGTIDAGRTRAEDGFVYADRLRQVEDNQFLARGGNFTSCDNVEAGKDPHYHFTSNKMRIYLKDKVVAKPVTLYIRDIPILAIPFYVFSVRSGRQSGFLTPDLDFGLGGNSGRFFRNLGYYWAASEYYDFTFSTDYTERPSRFVGRLNARYAKRYLMDGNLSFARTLGARESQFDLVGAHQMTLGDWRVTGRAEFRDREFRRDEALGPDFGSRLDRQLISDISASRSFPFGASLSLTARREKDLDAEFGDGVDERVLTETFPRYSFNLNSRTVGRLPDENGEGGRWPGLASVRFSFRSSGSSVRTETERTLFGMPDTVFAAPDTVVIPADTTFALIGDRNSNARHSLNISDTRKLLGALNISPNVNLTESWVDREFSADDTTRGFNRAAVWSSGVNANTTLYGTFPGLGPVTAVRHTFRPSASFTYSPEFSTLTYRDSTGARRNRFPGVSASEQKRLGVSMEHGFQAKLRSEDGERRVNLFRLTSSSSYDFVRAQAGGDGWENIRSTLNLEQPIFGVSLNFSAVNNPYRQLRFENYQATGAFTLSGVLPGSAPGSPPPPEIAPDPTASWDRLGADLAMRDRPRVGSGAVSSETLNWDAGFSFSYAGSRDFTGGFNKSASINGRARVRLSKNWLVNYDNRVDLLGGEVLGENLSLTRDLHCWEATFTRSRLGSDTSFYFRINVKSLPDLKYEQGRRGGTGFGGLSRLIP